MPERLGESAGSGGLRAARALIGWMSSEEGQLLLSGRQATGRLDEGLRRRLEAARQAVSERPEGIDQSGIVQPVPASLGAYLEVFWETDYARSFKEEGWQVKLVDLRGLCAFQPSVFLDHAETRTAEAEAGDPEALARITLPLESDSVPSIQFDHQQKAWLVSSDNPNLDVIGHFSRPLKGGGGCGFLVALQPSFMQVISVRDRYLLKDGYHRALGLLARGVHLVPALFLETSADRDFDLGTGLLPRQAWLGPRPPRLTDYLLDTVAAEIALPTARRMVVIQALTLNPIG